MDARQDQERLRDLHRRLEAGQCPEEHGAVPDRQRQQGRCGRLRKRRHGLAASSPRSKRRASPAPFRSPARTATRRRSTASRSARRPCRSGRTRARSARPPAKPPSPSPKAPTSTTLPGVSKFNKGKKGVEVNAILLDPGSDHQGHARPCDRRRLDQQGRGLRRRQGGHGCRPATDRACQRRGVEPSWPRHPAGWRGLCSSDHENKAAKSGRADGEDSHVDDQRHRHLRARAERRRRVRRFLRATELDTRMLGMVAALLVIWVGFDIYSGIVRPGEGLFGGSFLTPRNIWILLVQTSSIAVMTTGMVLIIVMRQIDLSVGSMLEPHRRVASAYLQVYKLGPAAGRRPSSDLDHRACCSRLRLGAVDRLLQRHADRLCRRFRPSSSRSAASSPIAARPGG